MELRGKDVLVIGGGLSGVASCRFLLSRGAYVTLADRKKRRDLPAKAQALFKQGVKFLPQRYLPVSLPWQICIKSPGVPPDIPLLQLLKLAQIPVWGELELAYRYASAPFIAVTGTNGKTTTTALLGYILKQAGINALVAGNIGDPLTAHINEEYDNIVAETSSFQLEDTELFHAKGAVFLNLSPDHLDRHGDMDRYRAAKARVLRHQQAADFAVFNLDDASVAALAEHTAARRLFFSLEKQVTEGAFIERGHIYLREDGQSIPVMPAQKIYMKGRHNWQNALAALAAARALGVEPASAAKALATFPGVEHRLEFVCEKNGVTYINDSKGTNPDSTEKALLAYEQPLVLIAGGYDKKADFSPLMDTIKKRVRHLVVLGQTAEALLNAAGEAGYASVSRAGSFEDAVALAKKQARYGDIVMLSPACASWDMFENFEIRGRRFKELIEKEERP
ncbi:MAG: UDP-N-acetylmuramoyl-L-alanine--D-glutamate ligase [Clostridiales bacterium]|nr:UDP-N-acetylmuramoyl-L-alanine--D-glutamate ligase [Clostridiales bacterium]